MTNIRCDYIYVGDDMGFEPQGNKYGDKSLSEGATGRHSGALFQIYRDTLRLTHFHMVELVYIPKKGYTAHQSLHQCSLEYAKCTQNKFYLWRRNRLVVRNRENGYFAKSQRPTKSCTITDWLDNGSSPIFLDTKSPAQSNFTTWYPGICKI